MPNFLKGIVKIYRMKWDRFNKFPNPHTTKIILEVTDGWHINTLNKNGFRPLHLAVKVCTGFNGRIHVAKFTHKGPLS